MIASIGFSFEIIKVSKVPFLSLGVPPDIQIKVGSFCWLLLFHFLFLRGWLLLFVHDELLFFLFPFLFLLFLHCLPLMQSLEVGLGFVEGGHILPSLYHIDLVEILVTWLLELVLGVLSFWSLSLLDEVGIEVNLPLKIFSHVSHTYSLLLIDNFSLLGCVGWNLLFLGLFFFFGLELL